ncbi:MAG: hypothetical protein LBE67_06520 [Kocuria palustris]|nr:hypothetical protein [Kocuria palustris]
MLGDARGARLVRVLVLASRRPPTLSGAAAGPDAAGPGTAMTRATTVRPIGAPCDRARNDDEHRIGGSRARTPTADHPSNPAWLRGR